ncbi:MAG: hypothetical protein ACLGI2_00650 [Acidimicrobiia bacterium]
MDTICSTPIEAITRPGPLFLSSRISVVDGPPRGSGPPAAKTLPIGCGALTGHAPLPAVGGFRASVTQWSQATDVTVKPPM